MGQAAGPAEETTPPAPPVDLSGRVAIVTGAGAGLGRAHARELARRGARVIVNDLAEAAAAEVTEEIRAAGGEALAHPGDVSALATATELVGAAVSRYGDLHVLVNNAGVLRDRMIFNMSEDEWDAVIRVHLRGHFAMSRAATAYWRDLSKRAGAPVYARVVNTSSEAFLLGSPGQPNYAAAKAGITALTVSTALSCARYGVRANAICPRARTAMTSAIFGPAPAEGADPLDPERVSPLVAYLASPAAEPVTGQVFVVYGGMVAYLNPPTVAASVTAPGGAWTAEGIAAALAPAFTADAAPPPFVSTEVLDLS